MDSSLILKVVCYELANLSNAKRKKSAGGGGRQIVFTRPENAKPVNKESQTRKARILFTAAHKFAKLARINL
jgi:hypothetical protein